MVKLSISPSKIEQFRLFYTEAFNGFITQENIITYLRGEQEWKDEMRFVSAYHAMIEFGPEKFFDPVRGVYVYTEDRMPGEIVLTKSELLPAIEYRAKYPGMINEMKAKYWTEVAGYRVLINMRIDGMNGLVVHERKTGKRTNGFDYYQASTQWKCYALATECKLIQYDIFKYNEPRSGPRKVEYIDPPYQFMPYTGMKNDVDHWIGQLIHFCEINNLMKFLISPYQ